jgi:predicted RNA-binding protein associated with RNAse of E/G family
MDPAGATIGFYFNLSDDTVITDGRLEWRDLTLDVLALPSGRIEVLDEHELPADLDPTARGHIEAGRRAIMDDPRRVMDEIEGRSRAIYGRLFGRLFGAGTDAT